MNGESRNLHHHLQANSGVVSSNRSLPPPSKSLPSRHSCSSCHLIRGCITYVLEIIFLKTQASTIIQCLARSLVLHHTISFLVVPNLFFISQYFSWHFSLLNINVYSVYTLLSSLWSSYSMLCILLQFITNLIRFISVRKIIFRYFRTQILNHNSTRMPKKL